MDIKKYIERRTHYLKILEVLNINLDSVKKEIKEINQSLKAWDNVLIMESE